jgi:hypothetical protein
VPVRYFRDQGVATFDGAIAGTTKATARYAGMIENHLGVQGPATKHWWTPWREFSRTNATLAHSGTGGWRVYSRLDGPGQIDPIDDNPVLVIFGWSFSSQGLR